MKFRHVAIRTAGTAVLALAVAVPLAGVAGAAEGTPGTKSFEDPRQRCLVGLDARLTALDRYQSAVSGSKHLTDAHESSLADELGDAESGLAALRPEIAASTTAAELRDLCPKVVNDYRVYVLEGPTVHLTIGADTASAAAERLSSIADHLANAIDEAQAAGREVGEAPALLNDMRTEVASAQELAAPVPDAVIPLTPSDYNAGTARPVLIESRSDLRTAKDALRTAGQDAKSIVEILRALAGS